MACVGLSAMFIEPVVGFVLDRFDHPRLIFPLYLFGVCGLLLVVYARGAPMFLLAGWLMGFSIGGQFTAMSYMLSRYFGVRDLGKISGIAYGVVMLTTSIFMVGLNAVFDATGAYGPAMLAVTPILLWNTVVPWLLGRYPKDASVVQAACV
jgi:MFS family permease